MSYFPRLTGIPVAIIMVINNLLAQWPTTITTDNSLYVCPGFLPGIVTFEDGSSIIMGVLINQIYVQKLDQFGNFVWPDPICAHNNDSSDITYTTGISNWGDYTTDGDGGVFIIWYDHRRAYYDSIYNDYENNAIYVQKIDKDGQIKWITGGVLVKSPESGLKDGRIVNDGVGGCIISWDDNGFDYPGAPNIERFYIQRISNGGSKLWEVVIDSSHTPYSLQSGNIVRLRDRFYIKYQSYFLAIDTNGTIIHHDKLSGYNAIETADTTLYVKMNSNIIGTSGDTTYYESSLARLTYNLDTVYTQIFNYEKLGEWMRNLTPIVPDGYGGIYPTWAYSIRVIDTSFYRKSVFRFNHFDGVSFWSDSGVALDSIDVPYAASDGEGGLVTLRYGSKIMRYDIDGNEVWPREVIMIHDHQNIYFPLYSGDHNGGMIMAFWTTSGGIHVQHSGRYGVVGIITGIKNHNYDNIYFSLFRNYPNPFNPSTQISFSVPRTTDATLKIYDILGREIAVLVNERKQPGEYKVAWNAEGVPSGVYFYRIVAGEFIETKKMVVVK